MQPIPKAPQSYFVTFEGIEGCGKSTQTHLFMKRLQEQGFEVTLLREPGGTAFGEALRKAILDSKTPLHPLAEAHLFASARAQLLSEKTLPLLAKPRHIVIHDRSVDSSLVYQGHARGLGFETILDLHQTPPLSYFPDLTFYLSISVETSFKRQAIRGQQQDYFEKEKKEFYQKLYEGHEKLMTFFPERIKKIDAELNEDQVASAISLLWDNYVATQS